MAFGAKGQLYFSAFGVRTHSPIRQSIGSPIPRFVGSSVHRFVGSSVRHYLNLGTPDREPFQSCLEAETYFGIAPVREQSGPSKKHIHFHSRLSQISASVFHQFAGHSIRFCDWAADFYQCQRTPRQGPSCRRARPGL
jgi:Transposase IS116/IS110/IS902 family